MSWRQVQRVLYETPVADATDALVLAAISDRAGDDGRRVHPDPTTTALLARVARCHRNTVTAALARLERAGHLQVIRRKGDRHEYVLPPVVDGPAQPDYAGTRTHMAVQARTPMAVQVEPGPVPSPAQPESAPTRTDMAVQGSHNLTVQHAYKNNGHNAAPRTVADAFWKQYDRDPGRMLPALENKVEDHGLDAVVAAMRKEPVLGPIDGVGWLTRLDRHLPKKPRFAPLPPEERRHAGQDPNCKECGTYEPTPEEAHAADVVRKAIGLWRRNGMRGDADDYREQAERLLQQESASA